MKAYLPINTVKPDFHEREPVFAVIHLFPNTRKFLVIQRKTACKPQRPAMDHPERFAHHNDHSTGFSLIVEEVGEEEILFILIPDYLMRLIVVFPYQDISGVKQEIFAGQPGVRVCAMNRFFRCGSGSMDNARCPPGAHQFLQRPELFVNRVHQHYAN